MGSRNFRCLSAVTKQSWWFRQLFDGSVLEDLIILSLLHIAFLKHSCCRRIPIMLSEQLKPFLEWKEVVMILEVQRTTGGTSESCESGNFEETVQGSFSSCCKLYAPSVSTLPRNLSYYNNFMRHEIKSPQLSCTRRDSIAIYWLLNSILFSQLFTTDLRHNLLTVTACVMSVWRLLYPLLKS